MMGERTVAQDALFYSFSLERHVPADHLLRSIDRFVDLSRHPRAASALLQRNGAALDRPGAARVVASRAGGRWIASRPVIRPSSQRKQGVTQNA
jgi:hypothetical protein